MAIFKDGIGRKFTGLAIGDIVAVLAPFLSDVTALQGLTAIVILTVAYLAANVAERWIARGK